MRKIIALLLLTLLTACAAPSQETALAESTAPVECVVPENKSMRASLVESSARPLLESEVLSAYERALRVYGWFDLAPLASSNETAVIDGMLCRRVIDSGIEDLNDLRTCLRSVFSEELTAQMLDGVTARIQYRDMDGALFVSGSRRDREAGVGESRAEVEPEDETTYYVNVLVDLMDAEGQSVVGQESWSFPYVFENDRWVFSYFELVY